MEFSDYATGGGWGADSLSMFDPQIAYCYGTITTDFTWMPASGMDDTTDPPPESVIVVESASAEADAYVTPPGDVPATCNDGLGQTGTLYEWEDIEDGQDMGTNGQASCSSTRYRVVSGADSLELTCSPAASASSSDEEVAHTNVFYSAGVSAVTIALSGVTVGSDGTDNIMIGQYCSTSLAGIPSGCTVSDYQWSVTGPTFQYWSSETPAIPPAPYNPDASYYVDGPGPLTNPTASWYWHENGNNKSFPETVSCTATVTPPAGEGSPFTVSATKNVNVWVPDWAASGTGGQVEVNTASPAGNGYDYCLWAAPAALGNYGGMDWTCTCVSPNYDLFGDGDIQLVQLMTPGMSYTDVNANTYEFSLDGEDGLDTDWPYGWVAYNPYRSNDNPGLNLTSLGAVAGSLTDSFEDYLMYCPSGSTQYVPLAHFYWYTNATVTMPTGGWPYFQNPAGTVWPSDTDGFLQTNEFPMWTQNDAVSNGHF